MIPFCLVSSDHGPLIINRLDYGEGNEGLYGVGAQILQNGAYEPEETGRLKALLTDRRRLHGDGVVGVDCGANIGVHSVEWAKHMRGWGSVIAVEAQERVYYALAGNLALQNCFNARAIFGAVDRICGEMLVPELDHSHASSFGSFELKERRTTEYIGQCVDYEEPTQKVKRLSIDSLDLARVDLIKLDIEGMEMDALIGASKTVARCQPDLYIEIAKSDRSEIEAFLRDMRYRIDHDKGMNILAKPDA